jgi:hypothetical protein
MEVSESLDIFAKAAPILKAVNFERICDIVDWLLTMMTR